MPQEDQSCGALVDELAEAVQQDGGDWQQTAHALRQRADTLDGADCYDAHMEMGTLLTARCSHMPVLSANLCLHCDCDYSQGSWGGECLFMAHLWMVMTQTHSAYLQTCTSSALMIQTRMNAAQGNTLLHMGHVMLNVMATMWWT